MLSILPMSPRDTNCGLLSSGRKLFRVICRHVCNHQPHVGPKLFLVICRHVCNHQPHGGRKLFLVICRHVYNHHRLCGGVCRSGCASRRNHLSEEVNSVMPLCINPSILMYIFAPSYGICKCQFCTPMLCDSCGAL